MAGLEDWLARGDLDELLRECDRLCERREWDDLVRLRDGARAAFDRGHQLWPAAAHAEYRLALEAPPEWAVPAVEAAATQFALGPLTEVVATTHRWVELQPHVTDARVGALIAHERIIRGDEVDPADGVDPTVLDLPLEILAWEPAYATATYHAHRIETPRPDLPRPGRPTPLPDPGTPVDDPDTASALHDLAAAWADDSNGRVEVTAVEGDAAAAVASLGPGRATLDRLPPSTALALMAWTAASGGAHGRRRGAAAGRFGAWWAAAALTDLLGDWPVPGADLGDAVAELAWYGWSAGEPDTGWACRLAVEDPGHGLAWAVNAVDAADD